MVTASRKKINCFIDYFEQGKMVKDKDIKPGKKDMVNTGPNFTLPNQTSSTPKTAMPDWSNIPEMSPQMYFLGHPKFAVLNEVVLKY